jgi:anti-sigma regulatory factor (Ser/Thr protein kinase)
MALEEIRQLPSAPASASTARRLVQRVAALALGSDLTDVATLLVSELVSNAVLHAQTEITITVRLSPSHLRVEVTDTNPSIPRAKSYSELSTTGRGLRLVDQLSDRWGIDIASPGKSVWFELTRPADPERAVWPDSAGADRRSDHNETAAPGRWSTAMDGLSTREHDPDHWGEDWAPGAFGAGHHQLALAGVEVP